MERETRQFATSGGHVVEIKTYLTVDETDSIQDALVEEMTIETGQDGKPGVQSFKASLVKKSRNAAISAVIVSIDSVLEDVLKSFLALPAKDGMEVVNEVNKINSGLDNEKKD